MDDPKLLELRERLQEARRKAGSVSTEEALAQMHRSLRGETRSMNTDPICIFCFRAKSDPTPWCKDNPGKGCQYGFACEYPIEEQSKPVQAKKVSKSLCVKCGLHPKNPAFNNGCEHQFPTE